MDSGLLPEPEPPEPPDPPSFSVKVSFFDGSSSPSDSSIPPWLVPPSSLVSPLVFSSSSPPPLLTSTDLLNNLSLYRACFRLRSELVPPSSLPNSNSRHRHGSGPPSRRRISLLLTNLVAAPFMLLVPMVKLQIHPPSQLRPPVDPQRMIAPNLLLPESRSLPAPPEPPDPPGPPVFLFLFLSFIAPSSISPPLSPLPTPDRYPSAAESASELRMAPWTRALPQLFVSQPLSVASPLSPPPQLAIDDISSCSYLSVTSSPNPNQAPLKCCRSSFKLSSSPSPSRYVIHFNLLPAATNSFKLWMTTSIAPHGRLCASDECVFFYQPPSLRPLPDIHSFQMYPVFQVCSPSSLSVYSVMNEYEMGVEWTVLELRSFTALCRSFTEIFSLCPKLFMDSCVICWASLPWCEGVLPTKSLVPEMLAPLDMYCLFFPKVPLSLSGLVDQDSSVLQGFSSRCFVLPAFVAGFFSAFVADIFSGFSSESNALTSVSDAADQDIHGILVFFDSSCVLLIKCICFYHVYLASWLANLWLLFMNYLVTPPLLMEFY